MSTCQWSEGCDNLCEGTTDYCATHNWMLRKQKKKDLKPKKVKQPLAKVSGKMASQLSEYSKEKQKWIKGKMCVVHPHLKATTIHHAKGRVGYADDWARQQGITLLLDKRYWVPASLDGHRFIELNRKWAEERGFTYSRLEKM